MKNIIIISFLFFSTSLCAQQINGVVKDAATKKPITNVQFITRTTSFFSNAEGKFTLLNVKIGENIGVRILGYESTEITLTNKMINDTLYIYLQQNAINLNTVTIKTARNYKRDSLEIRKEYAKVFAYKGPSAYDIFSKKSIQKSPFPNAIPNSTASIIGVNVFQLINMIGAKKSKINKFKQTLLLDEESRYVDQIFSREKVGSITALTGDSLANFMNKYRPSLINLKKMTGYEMNLYIKKSYQEFKKP